MPWWGSILALCTWLDSEITCGWAIRSHFQPPLLHPHARVTVVTDNLDCLGCHHAPGGQLHWRTGCPRDIACMDGYPLRTWSPRSWLPDLRTITVRFVAENDGPLGQSRDRNSSSGPLDTVPASGWRNRARSAGRQAIAGDRRTPSAAFAGSYRSQSI